MANKDFGVKQINLIGASGTPTITSPNNLVINATSVDISTDLSIGGEITSNIIVGSGYSIGIGTTAPISTFHVFGDVNVSGVSTFSGNINVSGVSTFSGNINLSTGNIIIPTDSIIKIGDLSQLELYVNGGEGQVIKSTSDLVLRQTNFLVANAANTQNIIRASQGGSVDLYHANNLKISTSGVGVTVYGETYSESLKVTGISSFFNDVFIKEYDYLNNTNQIILGDKFRMFADGSNTYLKNFNNNTGGDLYIESDAVILRKYDGSQIIAQFNEGGSCDLYFNNFKEFETTSTGVSIAKTTQTTNLSVGAGGTTIYTYNNFVGINTTFPSESLDVIGNVKIIGDVNVGLDNSQGLVMTSPNGTQYRLIVDDSGNLSTSIINP